MMRITKNLIKRRLTKTNSMMIIYSLALLVLAVMPLTAVEAQTARTSTMTTTATENSTTDTTSSGIELSQQPVLTEQVRTVSETPINYEYVSIAYTGNGTLTLPNDHINTATNFTSNGNALISIVTQSVQGTETIKTEDDETAIATFHEIVKFNPATRDANGIITAVVHTNPDGALAPLNGMVLVGIDDISPNGESKVTFWEWESGVNNFDIVPVQDDFLNLQ
jgi:hypothetical protein